MSDQEKIKIAVIKKMKELEKEKRTEDYEKGFDDCLEIIRSVFNLTRE